MIIVKLSVNKQLTEDYWKNIAQGTTDSYGNPFRIIRLRWMNSKLHKNAEYAKTRGFEDAVLSKNAVTGDIKITYRRNGSIVWLRPPGGVGPYIGEVAETPRNLRLLASHYGDKLWTIVDRDVDAIVHKMYETMRADMSQKQRDFNDKRIAKMHTMSVEESDSGSVNIPVDAERMSLQEDRRLLMQEKTAQDQRKAALDEKEKLLNKKAVSLVGEGVMPVFYSEEHLKSLKIFDLRKVAKEIGVDYSSGDKSEGLIKKILDRQAGKKAEAQEKVTTVMAGLDD